MTREEIEQARAYLRGEGNPDFPGLARLGERLLAEVERLNASHERIASKVRAALEAERKVAAEYRRALEAIRDLAQETAHALPDRPTVKHNAAVGPLLTLSGLAETALES